jgi:hypothetical protein
MHEIHEFESEELQRNLSDLIASGFNPIIHYRKSQDMRLSEDYRKIYVMAIIWAFGYDFAGMSNTLSYSKQALTSFGTVKNISPFNHLISGDCVTKVIKAIHCDNQSDDFYEIFIDVSLLTPAGYKVAQALQEQNNGAITSEVLGSGQASGKLILA